MKCGKENSIYTHNVNASSNPAFVLAGLTHPEFPIPVGVFRKVSKPTYSELVFEQNAGVQQKMGKGKLEDIFTSGTTCTVE